MVFTLPIPPDFSFRETLSAHGWRRLLPFAWDEDTQTLERTEETPDGGIVLLRMHDKDGVLHIDMEGEADEAEMTRRIIRMLQLDLPIGDFHSYCRTVPELAGLIESRQGRMLRSPTLWEDTVKVIATTNTAWAQTIAMSARLVNHFGAEGLGFPTPQRIADVPFEEFAARARMGYRSAYVYKIAAAIAEGSLDLESLQEGGVTASELRKHLASLPGIGPYGAACLMLYLGRPEHVNSDSVARAALSRELGRTVTDQDVLAFFERHGQWRGLVYTFYPWSTGQGERILTRIVLPAMGRNSRCVELEKHCLTSVTEVTRKSPRNEFRG
jgi:3-methyladenine DNA glycosylase/8-oxoguanine DNA glycosylase